MNGGNFLGVYCHYSGSSLVALGNCGLFFTMAVAHQVYCCRSKEEIATDRLNELMRKHKDTDDSVQYHAAVLELLRNGACLDWAPYSWSPLNDGGQVPGSAFGTLWDRLFDNRDLDLIKAS